MKNIEKHIINYLNGELSKSSLNELENWLKETKNQKIFKEFVTANHFVDLKNQSFDLEKGYASFDKRTNEVKVIRSNFKKSYRSILRYAALLIVTLGIPYYIFNTSNSTQLTQVHIPKGEKGEVILPDGTKVILNSNSTLKYPLSFANDSREVYLEGEAFFDVVKNSNKPFKVSLSSNIDVKVLGTTFNIKAYTEDSKIETTLFTGKVELIYKEKESIKTILFPGNKASYQKLKSKMVFTQINEFGDDVAWKKGMLVFKGETLENIANELNRFFDAEIIIEDQELENQLFTASFEKGVTLKEVLKSLEISGNFKCNKISDKKWELIIKYNVPMN